MPTYSSEYDPGDYRANDQTRQRLGYGGQENGGQIYAQRSQGMGGQAAGRLAYQSDFGQSNEARGYGLDDRDRQNTAADLLEGAARGRAPSQAEILARSNTEDAVRAQQSMAAGVKGGAGARVAAMRNAGRVGAQMQAQGAQRAEAMRAAEMASARGQLVGATNALRQGDVAMRGQDLGEAQIQQQNELTQRGLNDQQQRFFEGQATGIQTQDQNNQLAQQQIANGAWATGRAATQSDEGFGFSKDLTYAKAGTGAAVGGVTGAMTSGGGSGNPDPDMGSDEAMKNVFPGSLASLGTAGGGMAPMSGAAPATFDKMSPGGGMDVMGSLRAHSNFATQYQRDPSGGMMRSSEETKDIQPYEEAQSAVDARRGAGDYAKLDMTPIPAPAYATPMDDAAMLGPGDAADPYARRSKSDRDADRKTAGTAPSHGSVIGGSLLGFLRGFAMSDERTKDVVAQKAFAAGVHAAAPGSDHVGADEKREMMRMMGSYSGSAEGAGTAHGVDSATYVNTATPAERAAAYRRSPDAREFALSVMTPRGPSAEDNAAFEAERARVMGKGEPSAPIVHKHLNVQPFEYESVEPAQPAPAAAAQRPSAAPPPQRVAMRSDERTKHDEGVPEREMFAAMKSMKPSLYAYKPGFTPPEQAPGELQVGPMANPMEKDPVARMAIVKDPDTGFLAIDKDKALKLTMGSLAVLANKVDDLEGDKKRKKVSR